MSGNAPPRSYLYVPADRPDMLARAAGRGADALIVDLEDAVAAGSKENARRTLAQWLAGQPDLRCELWLRINPGAASHDITEAVVAQVTGVVVPKAEPQILAEVHTVLCACERAANVTVGRTQTLPLIESARGLQLAAQTAATPRVARLGFGEADLAADLGVAPGGEEFTSLRVQVVVACAAAGIGAPVGPAATDYRDLAALRDSTQALLRQGFRARTAIHPAQISTINSVFTPSAEEVERARRLLAAFDQAARRGDGIIADERGRMVDAAVIRSARETLARAAREPTDA
jgi:citrate lyase subunit beta/citryl-CoA lyase